MPGGLGMQAKLLAVIFCLAALGLYTAFRSLPAPNMPGHVARHAPRIIVVGFGLAGTAAALAAAEAGGPQAQVVVLEKEARPGGNSMKASSGINALTPESGDSAEAFREDTVKSGGGLSSPELVNALVVRSCSKLAHGLLPCFAAWEAQSGGNSGVRFRVHSKFVCTAKTLASLPLPRPALPRRATAKQPLPGCSPVASTWPAWCSWGGTAASARTRPARGPWAFQS